jgi:hypothetical protein
MHYKRVPIRTRCLLRNYECEESQQARNIRVWSVALSTQYSVTLRIARVIPLKNGYATRAMSYHLTGRLSHTLPLTLHCSLRGEYRAQSTAPEHIHRKLTKFDAEVRGVTKDNDIITYPSAIERGNIHCAKQNAAKNALCARAR